MTNTVKDSIDVLIVNFRTKELTADAVLSALQEPETAQVIVVDNCSGDDSYEFLRTRFQSEPRVVIVESPKNAGFGSGNNLAASQGSAPWLFLLNSDATLHRGSLALLLECAKAHPEAGILAPSVYLRDGQLQADAVGVFPTAWAILTRRSTQYPTHDSPDWVGGAALLISRKEFEAVGGFNEAIFMYYEDVLLCWNIRKLGKTILRCPAAGVTHLEGGSKQSQWKRKQQYYAAQDVMLKLMGQPLLLRALVKLARLPYVAYCRLTGKFSG